MITLENLKDASPQDVFNQMYKHLMNQEFRSYDEAGGFCVYHHKDGRRCAGGCFITKEQFRVAKLEHGEGGFNGMPWSSLVENGIAPESHWKMIALAQFIHDNPTSWDADKSIMKEELGRLAKQFSLKVPDSYYEEQSLWLQES